MSAAATAAGYLYASGRMRGREKSPEERRAQRDAERAAEDLKREREQRKPISTAPTGARRR